MNCRRCGLDHWETQERPYLLSPTACPRYGYHSYLLPSPTPEEMVKVGLNSGLWMWGPTVQDTPDGGKELLFGFDSSD